MDNEEDCGHVIRAGDYGRHCNNDDVRDDLHQDSENAGGDEIQGNETPLYMILHFADLWSARVTEEEGINE